MQYGLYIHIPYCRSKCRYCDFYSVPASAAVPDEYIHAVLKSFAGFAPKGEDGAPLPPATVYFGGGTPSLLSAGQVLRILKEVNPQSGAEITLEANPESCTEEKLCGWRAAGVNRLSLGLQTANAKSLKRLGRLHTAQDAANAMAAAKKEGFNNLSADIMLALPEYTYAEFDETLSIAKEGGAAHISAYMLSVEEGTPFGKNTPSGIPEADEAAEIYLYAVRQLKNAGYEQYEISNFAKQGFQGRHNLIYWSGGNWLGLGPAAHSCINGRRFSFLPNAEAFCQNPAGGIKEEGRFCKEDYIMLRLRLAEGLCEDTLAEKFGAGLEEKQRDFLNSLCGQGMAKKLKNSWALTPNGLLVQNSILSALLS